MWETKTLTSNTLVYPIPLKYKICLICTLSHLAFGVDFSTILYTCYICTAAHACMAPANSLVCNLSTVQDTWSLVHVIYINWTCTSTGYTVQEHSFCVISKVPPFYPLCSMILKHVHLGCDCCQWEIVVVIFQKFPYISSYTDQQV